MRLLKASCCKMLKVIVFSILCLLSICTVGCNKKQLNEEHTHTKVHVLKIEPTCIREGRIEYWFCSQCKKVFKDSDALYEITMEETKLPKKEHTIEVDLEKDATCEEEGLTRGMHCTTCHEIIEEQTLIEPLGHNFNFNQAVWEWEEFHSAKLEVSCTNNKEHKNTYPAEITSTTIPATCTDAGKIIYTANVLIDQKEYKDKKEELLLPLEHDFDLENITWIWNEDSSAYAQISCKHDDLHILTCDAALQVNETPSTCTAGGKRITTAVVTIQGQQYRDVKEVELPEIGHSFDYENIEWTWEGYSSSFAKVTCQNDKSHQVSYEAKITTKTEQPTCMKEGKKTYLAEINVSGKSYIDEKEEILEALNHDFDYENYTWRWQEHNEATLCFECKNDPSHLDTYTAQIKANKVLATCVTEGRVIYSANIILNDQSYTDEKEEILPIDPMNHVYDYEHLLWIWDSVVDGYIASLYIDCVCNKATVAYDANPLKIEYKPSSFETEGFKKYQAEVLINGVSYKDSKTEVLPVKQYVSSEEDFYQKIQSSSCDLTLTNDITLTSEVILEGSYAAIDLNGYTLTIPNSKFSFKATHSYIRNGYLETDLGSYVILGEDKANLLVDNVTAFGGILVKNATASIQNVDITATLESAISARMRGNVVVENSILRKNYSGITNSFLFIEESNFDNEVFFGSSELSIKDNVQLLTTTNAALYPTSNSLAPIYDSEPVINHIEVKEYLSSSLRYKCLSLSEDLVYSKEELQDEAILIEGKRLVIDLGGHTLTVPANRLTITASFTRIRNGNLKAIADEDTASSFTIMALNSCKAVVENVQAIGSIKTDNASVTFKDVVINSAF